jgi:hypothetical protein
MKPRSLMFTAVPIFATALGLGTSVSNAQSVPWTTIVNNGDVMPPSANILFNSYNQPSINANGLVVFRARSKGAGEGGGGGAGGTASGIYERDMSLGNAPILRVLDRTSLVPAPNNLDATFTEFPSIPRIDITTSTIATRGQSSPVWQYTLPDGTETRTGTAGIYMNEGPIAPFTAMSQLGAVPGFSYWQVPNAPPGTKFDQFPGAPSPTGQYVAFKGNWTDASGVGQTGVYYRNVISDGGKAPVQVIADTSTVIPNQPAGGTVKFGSTAPPSAEGQQMVFVGLDNEDAPTLGGIYLASLEPASPLTTLIGIGDPVPGVPGATLNKLGEGLSFDGRYVSFWGAWGTQTRTITLICPSSGNQDLIAYCLSQYPNGFTTTEPVNQGIFVTDTLTEKTVLVAQTGGVAYDRMYNFLYWVFSGRPPGTGGGDGDDFEPARWRSSAFTALSAARGSYQVAFKATKDDGTQGIYLASGLNPQLAFHTIIVDTHTFGVVIDREVTGLGSATPLTVTSVGIERDGFRNQRLTVSIAMANADASVSWAGLYLRNTTLFTR